MGAWGHKAWDSDGAADWFSSAFRGCRIDDRLDDALRDYYAYEEIRAAAYLLTVLGCSAYVWPGDLDRLDEHVNKAIKHMEDMANPDADSGREMRELWGEDSPVHEEVKRELAALKAAHRRDL